MRLQRAVPTSEKFTAQLSALYFRHHVIRQRWQRAQRQQQRGRSVYANISGGRKHFPSYIFRLFHSWLTALQSAAGRFHTKKLCSRLYSIEVDFYSKNEKSFLSHHLGDLGLTYALHLHLVGKPVIAFLFVTTELFCYILRLRRYKWKSTEVGAFRRGWAILSANFRRKGASATNHCWC